MKLIFLSSILFKYVSSCTCPSNTFRPQNPSAEIVAVELPEEVPSCLYAPETTKQVEYTCTAQNGVGEDCALYTHTTTIEVPEAFVCEVRFREFGHFKVYNDCHRDGLFFRYNSYRWTPDDS